LRAKGCEVTVLDRDVAMPGGLTPQTSWDWPRRSAPQVQHPHFLMGRLRALLHHEHPELLAELFAAGVWELPFLDTVHPAARARYRPEPGDLDLVPLCARRTTFELVVRRYIEERGIANIRSAARVDDLLLEHPKGAPTAVGCRIIVDDHEEELLADLVVVASGRGSNVVQKLQTAGISIEEEHHPSQTVYYTRHYRLLEGARFPALSGLPAVDFADFTLGALPADNGTFTITLAVWKDDPLLVAAGQDVGVFERICASVPKIRPWVDPGRVEPVSGIMTFAAMDYLWRRTVHDGSPTVVNLFLVGDSAIRTNPKFGRGCTWGSLAAHRLADVLADVKDPGERVIRYESALWDEFREDWETLWKLEQRSRAKFEALIGKRRRSPGLRLNAKIDDHIMNVAMAADSGVQRAIMRGYHGLDGMADWTRRPRVWLGIVAAARPSRVLREVRASSAGRPTREEIASMTAPVS
jgi:2-polyprenyl-6-methoxyphenol hydroxylase-like FAD-dependent oxidoreductase